MKCLILITSLFFGVGAMRPLIVWHGVSDDCEGFAGSMIAKIRFRDTEDNHGGAVRKQKTNLAGYLSEAIAPGLYVHCIQIGDTAKKDHRNSLFMDGRKQLDIACDQVMKDENLRDGFNAFGISQGGLFLRALIERCPPSKVHNFVTFSAPHQGVFGIPNCFNAVSASLCRFITSSLTRAAYTPFVQRLFTPAQYWHDPMKEEQYRAKSEFAAVYNNERDFNPDYKKNLLKVNKFVVTRNTEDEVIVPRESSHFGYYREGQRIDVVNFTETRLYKDDLIGLKELYQSGRLTFEELPGKHMSYSYNWLVRITSDYFMD